MTRVMFLIQEMSSIDPDDPALPKNVTPEKIKDGIDASMEKMVDRGWTGELVAIKPTDAGVKSFAKQLASEKYDCVVVGGAIRLPEKNLEFFEKVINAIRESAPECAIAFNGSLTDMHEAAARWVDSKSKT